MDDLEFIKRFSKITVKGVCERKKLTRTNVITGKTKKSNIKKVRQGIESEIAKLYLEENEDNE